MPFILNSNVGWLLTYLSVSIDSATWSFFVLCHLVLNKVDSSFIDVR